MTCWSRASRISNVSPTIRVRRSTSRCSPVSRCMSAQPPEPATPAQRCVRAGDGGSRRGASVARRRFGRVAHRRLLVAAGAEKALKAGLFAASISAPKIHGLVQLLRRYPAGASPLVELDDLDDLDPWVIDGRYGPTSPI